MLAMVFFFVGNGNKLLVFIFLKNYSTIENFDSIFTIIVSLNQISVFFNGIIRLKIFISFILHKKMICDYVYYA